MSNSGQLWALLIFSGLLLISLLTCVALLVLSMKNSNLELRKSNLDLLNRLVSEDARTYSLMTNLSQSVLHPSMTNSTEDMPYYPMSDAAEANRLQRIANAQGLGETIYDEEFTETMNELQGLGPDIRDRG